MLHKKNNVCCSYTFSSYEQSKTRVCNLFSQSKKYDKKISVKFMNKERVI